MELNSLSVASIQGWLGSICIVETIDCQLIMIFGEFAFIKSGLIPFPPKTKLTSCFVPQLARQHSCVL